MFGRKSQEEKIREDLDKAIQHQIDTAMGIQCAGKRYDALDTLLNEIEVQKNAFEKGDEVWMSGFLLAKCAIPAGMGMASLLKVFVISDIAATGGVLTIASMVGASIIQGSRNISRSADRCAFLTLFLHKAQQIMLKQQEMLKSSKPEQLASSENARKKLLENPGIKNVFIEEARRKAAEKLLIPPVRKKQPGFEI